jgi:general secretion pathway protein E
MLLIDILINRGLLAREDVALASIHTTPKELLAGLYASGLVDEHRVLTALSAELDIPYVDVSTHSVQPEALKLLSSREISRRQILPLLFKDGSLVVATSDPFDEEGLDELRLLTGSRLKTVLARTSELQSRIKELVGLGGGTLDELALSTHQTGQIAQDDDEDLASEASVMRLVNELIADAFSRRASDVHLEPTPTGIAVRYRIDGILQQESAPAEIHRFRSAIVSRIKIMAKLNIAERRLPQDGRIRTRVEERERDVRVSIIPMLYGEGVVLRLLESGRGAVRLGNIDFPADIASAFGSMIRSPHGLILVTGPTGSGKTTTLYSALAELRGPGVKIVTIEDPVEYELEGINQIQVQTKVGLTFAGGLRSVLRHDPDVILVGEIRDAETAHSAIQAAMTGHLVFSTLHTNDAPSAFSRLVDMGIERYLAAGSVLGVLAQRLVRKLCPHCRVAYQPNETDLPHDFPLPLPPRLWRAVGCRECRYLGYSGRTAIFELARSGPQLREAWLRDCDASEMRSAAALSGYVPLRSDGWSKAIAGITSVDEVVRVTGLEVDREQRTIGV